MIFAGLSEPRAVATGLWRNSIGLGFLQTRFDPVASALGSDTRKVAQVEDFGCGSDRITTQLGQPEGLFRHVSIRSLPLPVLTHRKVAQVENFGYAVREVNSSMPDEIKCARCEQKRPPLGYAPLPTDLGQKMAAEVCQACWAEWLQAQTRIINHYGLDLTNPEAQGFLIDNMKGFFYGASSDLAQIDTSKEGSIKW